jgi:hypothetical protein
MTVLMSCITTITVGMEGVGGAPGFTSGGPVEGEESAPDPEESLLGVEEDPVAAVAVAAVAVAAVAVAAVAAVAVAVAVVEGDWFLENAEIT